MSSDPPNSDDRQKVIPPHDKNGDADADSASHVATFDLLSIEAEERLLGESSHSSPAALFRAVAGGSNSPVTNATNSFGPAHTSSKTAPPPPTHANTVPSLRSISLPKGPAADMTKSETSPTLKSKHPSLQQLPEQLEHVEVMKKPKKQVTDYYKKQNELLESFKLDNEQIMVFQKTRTRQRLQSSTSVDPGEEQTAQPGTSDATAPLLKHNDIEDDGDLHSYRPGPEPHKQSKASSAVDIDSEKFEKKSSSANGNGSTSMKPATSDDLLIEKHEEAQRKSRNATKAASRLALATLFINVTLMFSKALASYLSGSLSILSSLADSVVDITSGLVIFGTTRAIKKRDPYLYPRGRTRLEPIALIVISTVMGIASFGLIIESVKRIATHSIDLNVDMVTAGIMIATILTKFTLMCICRQFKNEASINVLAQDHRNDCISNFVALTCAGLASYLGEKYDERWKFIDPIGALIVSFYIAYTWFSTGKEHMVMLSGKSAEPEFINRIIKVCIDHDPRINAIDTVYVYHWGTRFLVEVHIVLDETMSLKVAHDISESLQINIESLPEVERAFVHTDYEFTHQPQDEHKVV